MICKGCLDNQQLRSNPGLKLANAFGVIQTGLELANAFGVIEPGLELVNAFGVIEPGLN